MKVEYNVDESVCNRGLKSTWIGIFQDDQGS